MSDRRVEVSGGLEVDGAAGVPWPEPVEGSPPDAAATLAYTVTGRADRPALLLSNALGTVRSLWDPQLAVFEQHFRVIRYDTRGHGASSVTLGEYSIDQLGQDAIAVLDAAGAARAHICGISLGGLTAMWLGVHAPDRVGGLVMANTAARINSATHWQDRIDHVRAHGLRELAQVAPTRWFKAAFRDAHPQVVAATSAMLLDCAVPGYLGCCAALRDADLRADIGRIAAPALVIAGAADPATTPADAADICARVPHARLVTLDAAHLSNLEAAGAFTDAVVGFLADSSDREILHG